MRGIIRFIYWIQDTWERFQDWRIDREEEKIAIAKMDAEYTRKMADLKVGELKCKADVDNAEAKLATTKARR